MKRYIIKRIITAIVIVFITATLTFLLMKITPGSPFNSEKLTADQQAVMNAKYGLDQPLIVQYGRYLGNLLRGDMGDSMKIQKGAAVSDIIATSFPVSAGVGGIAIILSIVIGIPLGCWSALRRGKAADNVIRVFSTTGIAMPSFVLASLLLTIFSINLRALPSYGLETPAAYILPVISLALYPMCYIARLTRSGMLEALGNDYIRTARAKGMSERSITFKHALRNSLIPVITYVGPMVAYTVSGTFVVEKIFNIPGLGRFFVKSIENLDYPLIMGTTVFLAVIITVMMLVCDLLYVVVDPRIKLDD